MICMFKSFLISNEAKSSVKRTMRSRWFRSIRVVLYVVMSLWVFTLGLSLYVTSSIISVSYTNVLTEPNKVKVAEVNSDGFITQDNREMTYDDVDYYVSTAPGSDVYYLHGSETVLALPIEWYSLVVLGVPFYVMITVMCLFSKSIYREYSSKVRWLVVLFIALIVESGLVTSSYSSLFSGYGKVVYLSVVGFLTMLIAMYTYSLAREVRNS